MFPTSRECRCPRGTFLLIGGLQSPTCRALREPTCPAQGRKTKKYPPQRLSLITSRATGGDDLTTQKLHQAGRYIIQGEGTAPSRGHEAKPELPVQRSAAD